MSLHGNVSSKLVRVRVIKLYSHSRVVLYQSLLLAVATKILSEWTNLYLSTENSCCIHNETKAAMTTDTLWELGSHNFTTNHSKSRATTGESAKSPKKVDLGISRSQANSLNSITFVNEMFKPKVSSEKRKRPSSWTAPGQDASNFNGDDEEQIYDTVAPFTMASVETRGTTASDYGKKYGVIYNFHSNVLIPNMYSYDDSYNQYKCESWNQ